MNIGFTGHRDKIADEQSLLRIEQRYPGATWIHGGAEGFDSQVDKVARQLGKIEGETLFIFKPNYRMYPPAVAPLQRNKRIVDMAELMFVCFDGRKKGGTLFALNYAKQQGKPIEYLTPRQP